MAPTTVAPTTAVPILSFTSRSSQKTNITNLADNDGEGRKAIFIDRQYVSCDNSPLNQFQLGRSDNGIFYNYKCSEGGNLHSNSVFKQTKSQKMDANDGKDEGNITYLSGLDVNCEANSVLSSFGIKRDGSNWKYDYTCLPSKTQLACREVSTNLNPSDGGKIAYLDRHNVSCNNDEVLSQFMMVRDKDDIKYLYKCCK